MHGHIYIYIYATRQNKHNVSYRIPSYRLHFSSFFPCFCCCYCFCCLSVLFVLFCFYSRSLRFHSPSVTFCQMYEKKKGKETFYNNPFHEANSHVSFPPPSLTTSPFVYISIYLLPRLFPPYVLRVSLHRIHIYIYIPNSFFDPTLFFSFPYPFFLTMEKNYHRSHQVATKKKNKQRNKRRK